MPGRAHPGERIKSFQRNEYNFCRASLRQIDDLKGRGVVAEVDIPADAIICLFSGREVARLPEFGSFPRDEWPFRSQRDEGNLDQLQEQLPLSDYAISVSVLDFDAAHEEVGYHWRTLDPMADDEAIYGADGDGAAFRQLWDQHRDLDFLEPGTLFEIPESVAAMIAHKSEALYSRLLSNISNLQAMPISSAERYEFVVDNEYYIAPVILLNVNNRLEFVCARSDVQDKAYVLRMIKEALGKQFDAVGHARRDRRLALADKAKLLRLPDSYPHMAPFINRPHSNEQANAVFVDPVDWIPQLTWQRGDPDHAHLTQEARARELTQARLDYLQRPVVKSTQLIKRGTEILVEYNRVDT